VPGGWPVFSLVPFRALSGAATMAGGWRMGAAGGFDLDRPGLAVNQFGIGDAIWVFNAHGDVIRGANERADSTGTTRS